jgi:hypothetical protein
MKISANPTLNVPGTMALICAIYFPVALWLERDDAPVARPRGQIVQTIAQIRHVEGFGYQASTPVLIRYVDNDPDNQQSPIVLYENMTPLGPAHSTQYDVQFVGQGRYSHWGDNPKSGRRINGVLFSASDNSDPRTNGRHYWAVLPEAHTAGTD